MGAQPALGLDKLTTAGVRGLSAPPPHRPTAPPRQENIIYDIDEDGVSASGSGHVLCGLGEQDVILPPTR